MIKTTKQDDIDTLLDNAENKRIWMHIINTISVEILINITCNNSTSKNGPTKISCNGYMPSAVNINPNTKKFNTIKTTFTPTNW